MSLQNPRVYSYRRPYWNFWKVLLVGWMIRYPRPFFVALGFCIAVIYNAVVK